MTCAPRGIFSTKSDSRGRNATKREPRLDRKVVPSGVPTIVAVRDDAGVRVELAALGQRDEVAPVLVVDEQHLVAGAERVRHQAVVRSRTGSAPLARSTSLQNAHSWSGRRRATPFARAEVVLFGLCVGDEPRDDARRRKPK